MKYIQKHIITLLTLLFLLLLGSFTTEVWAYWTTDRNGTAQADNASIKGYVSNSGSTYYVLDASGEKSISLNILGNHVEQNYDIKGPAGTLTFKAKRSSRIAAGSLHVAQRVIGGGWTDKYDKNPGTSYEGSGNITLDEKAVELSFYGNYTSGTRYFKDVKVTMASYCTPEVDAVAFGAADINTANVSQTLKIYWSNKAAQTISTSGNTDRFILSTTSIPSQAGYYGNTVITITYKHDVAGSHSMTLTVNGQNVTVTGTTNKLTPEVVWSSNDAIFNVGDELSATNANGLTLTVSSTGNESYVGCSGNTATMLAATPGTITLTAHITGNNIYADRDVTKVISITELTKQHISWDRDFSRLKTTDATKSITLDATSDSDLPVSYELQGDKTGLTLTQNGNTWILTYSATECKNTTIIAKQGGNGTYAPASNVSKPIKVIDPKKVCDENETLVNSSVTLQNTYATYNIDIPSSMTIVVNRTVTFFMAVYTNGFDVEFYDGRNGTGNKLGDTHSFGPGDINSSKTISLSNLNIAAKSVKLISHANYGYDVTSVTYTKQKYCNIAPGSLSFETYPNTTTSAQTFDVGYANYPISLECSNNKFSFTPSEFGDCSEYGAQTVSVTYTAGAEEGNDIGYLLIKDNTGTTLRTCTLNVSVSKVDQSITETTIANSYNTTDSIELSAVANSGLTNFKYSATPSGIASFAGNVMTFSQSGTIAITVTQEGSNVYKPCSTTVANVQVNKVTPTIAEDPSGTSIKYLQTLENSTLSGGRASVTLRGKDNQTVDGSFAWTTPSQRVEEAAGNHSYGVTFTPNDGGMYNPNTSGSVSIMVNKASQTLSMKYGNVRVKVNGIDAEAADSRLNLNSLIVSQTSDPINNNRTGAVTYQVIGAQNNNANISSTSISNEGVFTATVCDTYTIRATKAETSYYNAATAEFTVTVGKRANTLELIADPEPQYVDNVVANVVKADKHNSNADLQTSSTANDIARYDTEYNRIIIPNENSESFNDTTVTISIWQEANDQFEESGVKTITLKVLKYSNEIYYTWDGNNGTTWVEFLNFDQSANVTFSAKNKEGGCPEITVTQTSGATNATYNKAQGKITASHNDASSAVWTISQAESRKYNGASRTLTVNVGTIASEGCNLISLHYDNEKTASQIHIPLPEVGTAGVLTFTMRRNHSEGDDAKLWTLVGTTWTERDIKVPNKSDSYVAYPSITLDPNTTAIRFDKNASIMGHYTFDDPFINDIQITRRTWLKLQDAAKDEIHELEIPTNTVSIDGANSKKAKFYVDYSTCDEVVRLSSSNPSKIQVSPSEFTPDHLGRKEITVTYTSNTLETIYDSITVYTANENKKLYIRTKTEKENQSIIWNDGFIGDPMTLPLGLTASNAATSTSGYLVTYTTDNDNIISISADGLSFSIVGTGTTTLTAHAEGDDTHWKSVEDAKTVKATGKKVQFIKWNHDYTYGLHPNDVADLDAVAMIPNYSTGVSSANDSLSALITYTCLENDDNVIQIIAGNKLKMLKPGDAKIQASLAGSAEYEAAEPVVLNVHVRAVSAGDCPTPLMFESDGELQFYQFDFKLDLSDIPGMINGSYKWTPEVVNYVILNHDNTSGEPDKLTFNVRGEAYTQSFGIFGSYEFFVGDIDVYQSIDGGNTWGEKLATVDAQQDQTVPSGEIQLDSRATHLKFVRPENGAGTHYVSDIKITRLPAISSEVAKVNGLPEVDLGDVMVGAEHSDYITFEYASVKGDLVVSKQNSTNALNELIINEPVIELDCGAFDTHDLPITFRPTVAGAWSEEVKIEDPISHLSYTVRVKANVTKSSQYIYWSPKKTILTTDNVALNAVATSGLPVSYEITEGDGVVASIVNNKVEIITEGTFTIVASQGGGDSYRPAVDVEVEFTVSKDTPRLTAIADAIKAGQTLGDVNLTASAVDSKESTVQGTFEWDEATDVPLSRGEYSKRLNFTPNKLEWYNTAYIIVSVHVKSSSDTYVYIGNSDDWSNPSNWRNGETPEGNGKDSIIINTNVTITDDLDIAHLTINGNLTVDSKVSVSTDLQVNNGGVLDLYDKMAVKNLIIEAKLGFTIDDSTTPASSGQVFGEELLTINGDVYFQLVLDPSGHNTLGWYDFVLPFAVDVIGGISIAEEPTAQLRFNQNYAIMAYDESKRAKNEKYWNKFTGTMQPDRIYSITLDETKPWNTVLFKKKAGAPIPNSNSFSASCTNEGKATDRGWNGLGNATLHHTKLDVADGDIVQLYDHQNRCYRQLPADDYIIAVGMTFFIQVDGGKTIILDEADNNGRFMAPAHDAKEIDKFRLALKQEGTENVSDYLWVSASEEATGEYVIGRDLLKMGEQKDAKVARMWTTRNDLILCEAEMPLIYSEADCTLDFFAPKQDTYVLEVEQAPENAELYLTYNGKVIWDLTASPSSIVLNKGTKEGYGLRIKSNKASTPQGIEDTNVENNTMRKVLIDNTMYIITPEGAMYSVAGELVR